MDRASEQPGGVATALRVGLLLLLVFWTVRLASGAADWCALDLVNLVFHEAGHVILRPLGSTLHLLGGTVFQIAVPAVLVAYFLTRRRDPFAAGACVWWLGESLANVARYMADARDLELPLIGGEHDWNELFWRFGVLDESSVAAISSVSICPVEMMANESRP